LKGAPLLLLVMLSLCVIPVASSCSSPLQQVLESRYNQMWPNLAPWIHSEVTIAENITVNSTTCQDHTKYVAVYSAYPVNNLGEVVATYTSSETAKGISVYLVRYDEVKIPAGFISVEESVSAIGVAASNPVIMQSSLSGTQAEEIPILVSYSSDNYIYITPITERILVGTGYPYPVYYQSAVQSTGSLQIPVGGSASKIKVVLISSSESSSGIDNTYLVMYNVNGKIGWTVVNVEYPYSGVPVVSNSVSGWIEEDSGIQDFDLRILKSPLVAISFIGYHKGTYGVWFKTLKVTSGGLEILYTALLWASPHCPSDASSISFASYLSSDGTEAYCLVAWLEVHLLNSPGYNTFQDNFFTSSTSNTTSPPPMYVVFARYVIVSLQDGSITVLPFYSNNQTYDVPILVYFRAYGKWSSSSTSQVTATVEGFDDISSVNVVYNANASTMKFLILLSSDVKPYYSLDKFLEMNTTTNFGYDILAIPFPGVEWYENNRYVPIGGLAAIYTFYNNDYFSIRTFINFNSKETYDSNADEYVFSDVVIENTFDPIFEFDITQYYEDNKGNNKDQVSQIGITTYVDIGGKEVQLLMINFANSTSNGWDLCEMTVMPLVGQLQYMYGSSAPGTLSFASQLSSDECVVPLKPVCVVEETSHPSSVDLGSLSSEVDVTISTVPGVRVMDWTPGTDYLVYMSATAPTNYAAAMATGKTAFETATELTVKFPALPTSGDVFTRVSEWLSTFVSENGTPSSPIVASGTGFQFTFLDTLASLLKPLSAKDLNALKTLVGVLNSQWTFDIFVGPSGFGYPSTLIQTVLGDWNASPPYVDFDPALALNTVLPAIWQTPVLQVFPVSFTAELSNLVVEATSEVTSTTTGTGVSPSSYSYPVPSPSPTSTGTSATSIQPPTTTPTTTSTTTGTTGETSTFTVIPCPIPVPRRRAEG